MSAVEYLAYLRPFYPTLGQANGGPAQISQAKLRPDVFQPRQWMVRHVTIDGLRLNAWTSDIGGSP